MLDLEPANLLTFARPVTTARDHQPPPQHTLIWMVVAAILLVLLIAVWRGWT